MLYTRIISSTVAAADVLHNRPAGFAAKSTTLKMATEKEKKYEKEIRRQK
jgi:hypothetical protein